MTIVAAIRWAANTITAGEAAGEVTRDEAEAIVTVAHDEGYDDRAIAAAFAEEGQSRVYRLLEPSPRRPPGGPVDRLIALRTSTDRSAIRVIDGFVSRFAATPNEYTSLPTHARIAFWESVLRTGARSPETLFEAWSPFAADVVTLALADLERARSPETEGTYADLIRAERTATLRYGDDPMPEPPSAEDLELFTRLSAEAAWDARVGSQDRGDVCAWGTSTIVPQIHEGSPVPHRTPRRAVLETSARVAAWIGGTASSYAMLTINAARGIALAAEAYDRTSPDYETRYRTYLRDAVRREAEDDGARETQIYRSLTATAERLEEIRAWHLAHPETMERGPVIRRAPSP